MAPVLLNPSRFASAGGGAYSAAVLADSPQLYWKLDETSGTVAADSSGNSRDGADTPGITIGATSLLTDGSGKARGFTANTSTGIQIPAAAWMSVSAFTIECLVKFSSAVDGTNGDALVSQYGSGGFRWLLWRNFSGQLACQINTTGFFNIPGTTVVSLGSTYHCVATWDGTNAKMHVAGVQEGSTVAVGGSLPACTEPLRVGCYSNAAGTVPGAVVDEFAFYNTALSSARIAAHAAAA